ncbi:MAG: hypothetical protein VB040_11350 [Propionibacterium sp.]|nr:hypothetical protein [Propionibacterium sp.]
MAGATEMLDDEIIDPVTGEIIDQKEPREAVAHPGEETGRELDCPGGLLSQLTKNVLEAALEAELTEHLGHEHGGTPITAHIWTRTNTILTEIGHLDPILSQRREPLMDCHTTKGQQWRRPYAERFDRTRPPTTRGFRNADNHRLRMFLIGGDLRIRPRLRSEESPKMSQVRSLSKKHKTAHQFPI